jgi:hypothetical protein
VADGLIITENALSRTLKIRSADTGTCFVLDVDGKQYIVTAHHIVQGVHTGDAIELWRDQTWEAHPVKVVGFGDPGVDIAVLAVNTTMSEAPNLIPDIAPSLGQDMFFLGFPDAHHVELPKEWRAPAMPLVMRATLSGVHGQGGIGLLLLGGYNHPGFSGGPLVFRPAAGGDLRVAGVVTGARVVNAPVFAVDNPANPSSELQTNFVARPIAGLMEAYSVHHVTELILRNPIGHHL